MGPTRIDDAWRRVNPPWQQWPSVLKTDGDRQWFEMTYNEHVLKYTVAVFGFQDPTEGYPLYIGLHGGGGEDPSFVTYRNTQTKLTPEDQEKLRMDRIADNDGEWLDVADRYYRAPVLNFCNPDGARLEGGGKGAVYIAVRGVSSIGTDGKPFDNWNLHSQPESFVLVERMVRNLFYSNPVELYQKTDYSRMLTGAESLVNSNRVYLLGFSAGGDGAFQFATRLPDLFAAVHAGGGHPNGVSFANTSNLPLSLQVGELDDTVKNRARTYAEVDADLASRRARFGQLTINSYAHRTCIVKGGKHDSWSQPDQVDSKQDIFKNIGAWYSNNLPSAKETTSEVIAPVPWVSKQTRNPHPRFLIWDLATRPTKPEIRTTSPPTTWQPKRFLHWLFIRSEDLAAMYQDTITAWIDKTSNSVHVDKARDYLGILLHVNMLDFNKAINVYIGDAKEPIVVPWVLNVDIPRKTWDLLRDKDLIFSNMIIFEKVNEKWTAKWADSLFDAKPQPKL